MHAKHPLIFHVGYARADPESPFIETMLETDVLTGLLLEEGLPSFKKAQLRLLPASVNGREAKFLAVDRRAKCFQAGASLF